MITILLWALFAVWLIGFNVLMLIYLIVDEDMMSFAKAMSTLLSIIIWPATFMHFVIDSNKKSIIDRLKNTVFVKSITSFIRFVRFENILKRAKAKSNIPQ